MVSCWLVQFLQKPQKFKNPTLSIFKTSLNENCLIKYCKYIHILSFYQTSYVWIQRFVCCLHKNNESLTFNRPPYMYFCLSPQVVLLNDVYLPKFFQNTNIIVPLSLAKILHHLRILNVRHFGIVEDVKLRIISQRSYSMTWSLHWI